MRAREGRCRGVRARGGSRKPSRAARPRAALRARARARWMAARRGRPRRRVRDRPRGPGSCALFSSSRQRKDGEGEHRLPEDAGFGGERIAPGERRAKDGPVESRRFHERFGIALGAGIGVLARVGDGNRRDVREAAHTARMRGIQHMGRALGVDARESLGPPPGEEERREVEHRVGSVEGPAQARGGRQHPHDGIRHRAIRRAHAPRGVRDRGRAPPRLVRAGAARSARPWRPPLR